MQTWEGIWKNNQYLFTYLVNVRGVLGLHKHLLTVLRILLVFFPFNMWFISILQRGGMVTETLYVKWWILGVWLSLFSSRHSYTYQSICPVIFKLQMFLCHVEGNLQLFLPTTLKPSKISHCAELCELLLKRAPSLGIAWALGEGRMNGSSLRVWRNFPSCLPAVGLDTDGFALPIVICASVKHSCK